MTAVQAIATVPDGDAEFDNARTQRLVSATIDPRAVAAELLEPLLLA